MPAMLRGLDLPYPPCPPFVKAGPPRGRVSAVGRIRSVAGVWYGPALLHDAASAGPTHPPVSAKDAGLEVRVLVAAGRAVVVVLFLELGPAEAEPATSP